MRNTRLIRQGYHDIMYRHINDYMRTITYMSRACLHVYAADMSTHCGTVATVQRTEQRRFKMEKLRARKGAVSGQIQCATFVLVRAISVRNEKDRKKKRRERQTCNPQTNSKKGEVREQENARNQAGQNVYIQLKEAPIAVFIPAICALR